MKDLNQVTLVGNLGRDAETKTFDNGDKIVRLNVATNRFWKDKSNEWQTATEWHTVTVRGPNADRASQLTKGARVMIQGALQTRKYDKDGQTRFATEVVVAGPGNFVADQTPRQQAMAEAAQQEAPPRPTSTSSGHDPFEDDIPF